jgi:hypothetical protein
MNPSKKCASRRMGLEGRQMDHMLVRKSETAR